MKRISRALGEACVAVARDRAQDDRNTARIALAAAGDGRQKARRVYVSEIEPPGDKTGDRILCRLGRLRAPVGPDQGDAHRAGVEAKRVRADDVAIDTAEPSLVDGAEAIDEKVVADVVPAVALHVVELDSLDDRRCLGSRVAIAPGRVVDDREPDIRRVGWRPAPDRFVRSP